MDLNKHCNLQYIHFIYNIKYNINILQVHQINLLKAQQTIIQKKYLKLYNILINKIREGNFALV